MTTAPEAPPFKVVHPDGRMEINPSEPQYRLLTSPAQIAGMQAGTGSGKTSVLVLWLQAEMQRCGPGDYLFAAPTFPLMEPRVIPELTELFVSLTRWGVYRPGYHRFESHEELNGRPAYRIFLGSASNPDSLESATYKAAAIDELAQGQFPRQAWEAINRRVAFHNGRICFGTTLYDVTSWYKTEIHDPWKLGDPRFDVIQAPSISNPAYPVERFEQARRTMPWWKFAMFHLGQYEKPTGLIYDVFNEETQVIPRFPIPKEWPRLWGHDFGPQNTAAVGLAQDPGTGLLYLYYEYLRGGLSVGQHAEGWKQATRDETVLRRVGGAWAEEEARYAYRAAGWPILQPGIRDAEAGIDRVYSFVAKNQLYVFSDCHRFLNEMLTYSRKLDENYEATDSIQNKARFHLMDSLRYIVSSLAPERAAERRQPLMKKAGAAAGRLRGRGRAIAGGGR